MNITASIKSRVRNVALRYFKFTTNGRKLKELQNKHKGQRCFIVGNGPSLRIEDLTTLHNHGEVTFAFNRIFQIFDKTPWRPYYFISQDSLALTTSAEEMSDIPAKAKFIPIEAKWYQGIQIEGAVYFHLTPNDEKDYHLFSKSIPSMIFNSTTVAYTAIQLAVWMGFKEIYLIGTDHHFHTTRDRHGKIHIDSNAKDYFADDYNKKRNGEWLPNVDASTMAFESAKAYADSMGISIFNATRGGKLEVFERRDFDNLF